MRRFPPLSPIRVFGVIRGCLCVEPNQRSSASISGFRLPIRRRHFFVTEGVTVFPKQVVQEKFIRLNPDYPLTPALSPGGGEGVPTIRRIRAATALTRHFVPTSRI